MINIIIVIAIIIWPWGPDYPGSWPWTFSTWRRSTSTIMNGRGSWWTTTGSVFYLEIFLLNICSAAISSLTTAWSAQPEKKERWSWTNLFATWSAPLMSLARNGMFLYFASTWKSYDTTTKLGWFFQRKFKTQVRKKEASCQTTSEDCYSIWRTAGIVPPHFDVRYNKVVYVFFCFRYNMDECRPSYIRINELFCTQTKETLCLW